MRTLRCAPRRRRARPLRVVGAGRPGSLVVDEDSARAIDVGLEGVTLLQQHYPAFAEAARVTDLPLTLPQLLGCCAAFWQLVDRDAGMPLLRWPEDDCGEMDPEATPELTLVAYDGCGEDFMTQAIAHFVTCPRPHYWGWGVESLMEEWDGDVSDALALTLWHLFGDTPWAIGADLAAVAEDGRVDLETITRLKPLPADTPLALLATKLVIPEAARFTVPPDELLRYAFGQCENELANHTDYEIEAIHYGELDEAWGWDDIPALIADAQEAQRLEQAYGAWQRRVTDRPEREIPALAADLRAAARAAAAELAQPPRALLSLIGRPLARREPEEALATL